MPPLSSSETRSRTFFIYIRKNNIILQRIFEEKGTDTFFYTPLGCEYCASAYSNSNRVLRGWRCHFVQDQKKCSCCTEKPNFCLSLLFVRMQPWYRCFGQCFDSIYLLINCHVCSTFSSPFQGILHGPPCQNVEKTLRKTFSSPFQGILHGPPCQNVEKAHFY